MRQFGLLGEHLGHSYSPMIHAMLGDYAYDLYEVPPERVGAFLRTCAFDGLNVTIPYKKTVLPYCAQLGPAARAIGSVNTIVRRKDGTLLGDNTDYAGFACLVEKSGAKVAGKKCLVFGTGGASLTVQAVLRDLGAAQVIAVSRTGENNYVNLMDRHADARILVNATPVGMFPNCGQAVIDPGRFPMAEAALDLIYNPQETEFLRLARRAGLVTQNGLVMLAAQAVRAAELFTGAAIDDARIDGITEIISRKTRNIALIGMAGCGKSSIGQTLARLTGRQFADTDAAVVQDAGMTIPEIFERFGEDRFRELETRALERLSGMSGYVIATGGGIVTRRENRDLLRRNSVTVWLRRELADLPAEGRPLSLAHGAAALYRQREMLYRQWGEYSFDNIGIEATAREIIKELKL